MILWRYSNVTANTRLDWRHRKRENNAEWEGKVMKELLEMIPQHVAMAGYEK